jgi:hypothetical protein
MLRGGHCWTPKEVVVLIVRDAFHKFGRRLYTWRVIILKEWKCVRFEVFTVVAMKNAIF